MAAIVEIKEKKNRQLPEFEKFRKKTHEGEKKLRS